jgi:hypothetical protein
MKALGFQPALRGSAESSQAKEDLKLRRKGGEEEIMLWIGGCSYGPITGRLKLSGIMAREPLGPA